MEGSKLRLPSLRAVEIFVAAAHALSFTAAANIMHLSPSAVSRRVRDLERDLATPLFRRFNRRLELTPAGACFLAAASQGIELIRRASVALRPPERGPTILRLSALQSLASIWLLPRLAVLKQRRPDLDILVETSTELVDLRAGRFDAAIRFGDGKWPGLLAEPLFATNAFPVAAPGSSECGKPISAAALDMAVLLEIAQMPDLWPQYLAAVGLAGYRPRRTQVFDNLQVMQEAAANGSGLALTVRELAERDLASGRLVCPFSNPPVALRQGYFLVCRREQTDRPAMRALRQTLALGCAGVTRSGDNVVCGNNRPLLA